MEAPQCPCCRIPFGTQSTIPMVLPSCGHSMCYPCLRMLETHGLGNWNCPECRQRIEKNAENIPKNYTAIDILENNSKAEGRNTILITDNDGDTSEENEEDIEDVMISATTSQKIKFLLEGNRTNKRRMISSIATARDSMERSKWSNQQIWADIQENLAHSEKILLKIPEIINECNTSFPDLWHIKQSVELDAERIRNFEINMEKSLMDIRKEIKEISVYLENNYHIEDLSRRNKASDYIKNCCKITFLFISVLFGVFLLFLIILALTFEYLI